ncbi:MAG TPA: fimbria/pilus outer membrane usher protein [Xanthobacteraceae bacterium]|nr:fimbria/pilus outer membrane usher protein [Xanthobacteraceae bacterium]
MRSHPRHKCVRNLVSAAATAVALWAWPAHASAIDGAEPLQLDILINGSKTGLLGSFFKLPNGKIAARRSELTEARIKVPGSGAPEEIVVLDDLLGDKYKYDEPSQSISFDLTDAQLVARQFDAMAPAPRIPVTTSWGSVLNYTLFGSETDGLKSQRMAFNGGSASLDARMFSPYGMFTQTGILGSTTTRDMTALRLESAFTYSDPESLDTYRVGDSVSGSLAWTRSIRFGGFQAQRNFALRSDLVTAPLPSFSGSAAVPSTLDVYLNNSKAYTQEVPPGPFEVNNLPLISGGEARVVLRDASGRAVETTLPFYTSPLLLKEDLTYFSVETGFPRVNYGVNSNDYVAKEFASLSVRHGASNWLTLEGHAEQVASLYNGGAGLLARIGNFGLLSAAVAGSWSSGQAGVESYLAFETRIWGITLGASSTRTFMNYNDVASVTAPVISSFVDVNVPPTSFAAPPKAIDRFTVGLRLPDFSSLGLSFVHLQQASNEISNVLSVAWSRSAIFQSQVFVTGFADISNHQNYGLFAGISIPLGEAASVSIGATSSRSGTSLTTDASRPLSSEPGSYGWRVRDSEGAVVDRSAAGSYRSSVGTVQAGIEQMQGNGIQGTAQVDGAIASIGGGFFATNRIDDSFAVVDTGAAGVPVLYENRPFGETNASGQLLVPNLRSYGSNKISIDPKNLGVNDEIETTESVVAPAQGSGVLVKFKTKTDLQEAVVILTGADGKPLAVGSKGKLDGSDSEFIVGYDGRAFVQDLKDANTVTVSLEKGECHASFDYTSASDHQVVIGPVACR